MNDLLQAAKAVIAEWDYYGNVYWEKIKTLRDAVERAEKQEAVGFEEWIEATPWTEWTTQNAWTAAQQAERERCREIVITMGGPDVPDLLRQIDSGEV